MPVSNSGRFGQYLTFSALKYSKECLKEFTHVRLHIEGAVNNQGLLLPKSGWGKAEKFRGAISDVVGKIFSQAGIGLTDLPKIGGCNWHPWHSWFPLPWAGEGCVVLAI